MKNKLFSTRSVVIMAMLTAVGYGLSWIEFPIFPATPFLQLDFSTFPTLFGGYMLGFPAALIIEGLKQVLWLLTHSSTAGVGQLANFIMTAAFVAVPTILYRWKKGRGWVLAGLGIGCVCQIAVSLVCNRFITFPLFMGEAAPAMFKQFFWYVAAFNAIKSVAISLLVFLLYKKLSIVLKRYVLYPQKKLTVCANKIVTKSEQQTHDFAAEYAKTLKGGEVIVLGGFLGAGKTAFVKGLASGLGIAEDVTSPTFTLMNDYSGRLNLYHMDVYRLKSGMEAYEAGLTDYMGVDDGVTCIEWAENIADALPKDYITIDIQRIDDNTREITINDK